MTYRAGIIGCGRIGSEFDENPGAKAVSSHAGAYSASDGVALVAVCDLDRIQRIKTVSPGLLGDPTAVIAVCQDLTQARARGNVLGETFLAPVDAAMATQNLLLAAHEEGLGTCVIASFHRGAVSRLLGIPETTEPMLLVSVGWPETAPEAPARRREGVVSFEVHGEG